MWTNRKRGLVHHVRVGLNPNDVGVDLVRTYVFDGSRLKLSGTDGLEPGFKFWTFTFERAKPQLHSLSDKNEALFVFPGSRVRHLSVNPTNRHLKIGQQNRAMISERQ